MARALQAGVTREAALKALRAMLGDAGVDGFAADARLLLCAAAGLSRADLLREPERALSEAAVRRLAPMAARRAAREPLSRIVGRREFWGLPLAISSAVLDPRADTETLVDAVVGALADRRAAPLRFSISAPARARSFARCSPNSAPRAASPSISRPRRRRRRGRTSPPAASPDAPTSSSVGGEARFAGRSTSSAIRNGTK